MPDRSTLSRLLGGEDQAFRGSAWPEDLATFRTDPEWFHALAALPVFRDPEEWIDRAPELYSFRSFTPLARSEARRNYLAGESIYIVGLDRTVKPLREICDALASELSLTPQDVMVQAWAAGGATSVGMHFDLDYNFNIQIAGRKQWQAAPNDLVAHPVVSHHAARGAGHVAADSGRALPSEMPANARTWEAQPGDVVYVPRGVWHSTRTNEASLAMAFVIQPLTWAEHLTKVLQDRLHADPRWRERVLRARQSSRHSALKATGREALAAAREILDTLGPSEMLYQSLWGQRPSFFKRRDDVEDVRLDESLEKLIWQRAGERHELAVPVWAHAAARLMSSSPRSWSVAALHDLVGDDDVLFLNLLVKHLVDAQFLEPAPAPSGGVAHG